MTLWLESALAVPGLKFSFPITQQCPHQDTTNDNSNCGVWICYYAEQVCLGRTLDEVSKNKVEDIALYRSVILVTLVREVPLELEY